MSEVLSQSQIDLILNSMRDGGDSAQQAPEPEVKKEEQGYKKYDFYSPKKFTRDKLKLINNIYENYSRILATKVNNLFRSSGEFEVLGVEEQRYYEFSNAVNDNDILSFVDLEMKNTKKGAPLLIHVDNRMMLSMIDRILGGEGDEVDIGIDYKYTDVEISLYDHIVSKITPSMREAWANYVDGHFNYMYSRMNQNVGQVIGMDETVVIVIISATIGSTEGKFTLCIPGTLLSLIFEAHENENLKKRGDNDSNEDEIILENVKASEMEIKVKFGSGEMKMRDAYSLRVGDTINLGRTKDSDVYMYVDDNLWFTGSLGVHKKNVAVKVKDIKSN